MALYQGSLEAEQSYFTAVPLASSASWAVSNLVTKILFSARGGVQNHGSEAGIQKIESVS